MRGIWSARECYCAVRVTVRRRWFDIVMLSSLSEGVPGVRFFTLPSRGGPTHRSPIIRVAPISGRNINRGAPIYHFVRGSAVAQTAEPLLRW